MCVCVCVTGGAGTLDELVGSHTKIAIYPTLAISCHRVVICALLNTGFKGMQVPYQLKVPKKVWVHAYG